MTKRGESSSFQINNNLLPVYLENNCIKAYSCIQKTNVCFQWSTNFITSLELSTQTIELWRNFDERELRSNSSKGVYSCATDDANACMENNKFGVLRTMLSNNLFMPIEFWLTICRKIATFIYIWQPELKNSLRSVKILI